jgi:hypothetical protein
MATVTKEDVIDAVDELSDNRLDLLTDYWQGLLDENAELSPDDLIATTLLSAQILYSAKAYQDTLDWLDATGADIAKTYGEESDHYVRFVEDEDIEDLRMNALDKSSIEEEEEEDDFNEDE